MFLTLPECYQKADSTKISLSLFCGRLAIVHPDCPCYYADEDSPELGWQEVKACHSTPDSANITEQVMNRKISGYDGE